MHVDDMQVRNVKPRGRSVARHREGIEKQRIAQRRAQHLRYDPNVVQNPFAIEKNASFYLPETHRFQLMGAAAEEKRLRDCSVHAKRQYIISKRSNNVVKEKNRWKEEEQKKHIEHQRVRRFREAGIKALANTSSVPYDTVTHKPKDSVEAVRLKYSEDRWKYKAEMRKNLLNTRQNGHYNPITGADYPRIIEPEEPRIPSQLRRQPTKKIRGHIL
eukprot:CAMPEP_0197526214 /NCGR_PEP_ID=MMETSP1318-20131121/16811_1 /TAXON_ID=552666 /ORGANISM="Partenskyella glossopodia, Strain RCC365" /LENGTH=215 /DNA_ID=CAMNT_0043080279 /DNA_START=132 /DNA_END=779 /DNA_ORIENTATION=+